MLKIENLQAFYGKSQVLHGVQFQVEPGEIVSLLGRNGSGRSTTAKAIMGLVDCQGSILWRGQQMVGRPAHDMALAGIGYVPESRDIFPGLTVHQNLQLGQKRRPRTAAWSFDEAYELFTPLKARQHTPAGVLSGGEQQMLALCRTLMGEPTLVMVDEPTEGLAPRMVDIVGQCLIALKKCGVSVLLIEQKLALALDLSDRCLVMGQGRVVFGGTPDQLHQDTDTRKEWLEV